MKPKVESNLFLPKYTLNISGRLIDFSKPLIMGILNVTPDSFFDGNLYESEDAIISRTATMLEEGATFIDVGGYSTRPGAKEIRLEEEVRRISFALKVITKHFGNAIISIDTFRAAVARVAVEHGAHLINDVSGGSLDSQMFQTVAALKVPYVMMHMKGNPQTMAQLSQYDNLLLEVIHSLQQRIETLHELGHTEIIIDPGFGFAKNIPQNFYMLNHLDRLKVLDKPLLVGLSRKSMIWKTLNLQPNEALNGTTALNTIALLKGASILRVHDVKEAAQVINLISHLKMNRDNF